MNNIIDVLDAIIAIAETDEENLSDVARADIVHGSFTEAGTGQRFVKFFKKYVKYAADANVWYVYNVKNGLWQEIEEKSLYHLILWISNMVAADAEQWTGNAKKAANKYVKAMRTVYHCKCALVFSAGQLSVKQCDFDSKPELKGLRNGKCINLLSMEIRDANADDMLTKSLQGMVKSVISDDFMQYLRNFLEDEELLQYVQMYCGSALLGHTLRHSDDKCALFIDSVSGTGKSTFLSCLREAMGSYYQSSSVKLLTQKNMDADKPSALMSDLPGVLLCGMSEIQAGTTFAGDTFKQLTGNDVVATRRPFGRNVFYFTPDFRLLIMSNELPKPDNSVGSDDIAFRSRFRRIRIEKPLKDKDGTILRKIAEQNWKDDCVTWLVQGCKKYLEKGRLDNYDGKNLDDCDLPDRMIKAIRQYIGENDNISDFFDTYYKITGNDKDRVCWRTMYQDWMDYTGNAIGLYKFTDMMRPLLRRLGIADKEKRGMMEKRYRQGSEYITEFGNYTGIFGLKVIQNVATCSEANKDWINPKAS